MNKNKGFTLIELLVVVAIIAILATVVVMALDTARAKGTDAAVKSNLMDAVQQGEIFWNTNTSAPNTYQQVCTSGNIGGIATIYTHVLTAAQASSLSSLNTDIGTAGTYNTATCHVDAAGSAWAAEVPLRGSTSSSPAMWCVDNTGKSEQESTNLAANVTSCPQ